MKLADIKSTNIFRGTVLILLLAFLASCEKDFFPKLEEAEPQIVVDAWINNKPEAQKIRLTYTQPYFDAVIPQGVNNALVYIIDNDNNRFNFAEKGTEGIYEWTPSVAQPAFGEIGNDYSLFIEADGNSYISLSKMNRVAEIDSIRFRFEEGNSFFPSSYFAEFFARDLEGIGDTYWIKAWKNGQFLNKPNEINIAFDAGFSAGGNVDGIYFIQPIRDAINPIDTDENDEFSSPYDPGDSVYVEVHSINYETFIYLNELQTQIDRPGGFAELFAVPLSNVPTNIVNTDPDGPAAVGFFNVSAVSTEGKKLDPNNLPQ